MRRLAFVSCFVFILPIISESKSINLDTGCWISEVIENGITCNQLSDEDLPFPDGHFPQGVYDVIDVQNSPLLTGLPKNSFGSGVVGSFFYMASTGVETFDPEFLGGPVEVQHVKTIRIFSCPATSFPWQSLVDFTSLQRFEFAHSSLSQLSEEIPWTPSVTHIDLGYNSNLTVIPSNAFKSASGLEQLKLWSSGKYSVRENGLRITSAKWPSFETYQNGGCITEVESNAFGNVVGGNLWGNLSIPWCAFPEETFRVMLKTAFDKGRHDLFNSNKGVVKLDSCGCEISWLFKDAHKYGIDQYKDLIDDISGGNNIICPEGPVLTTANPEFIFRMEACPETPIPWGENYCKDHSSSGSTTDTTADPNDCHCFYHCTSQDTVAGHECCKPGLAYNPEIEICDWVANVPNCE